MTKIRPLILSSLAASLVLLVLSCLVLASCQSPKIGKHERSDPHEFRRAEPAKGICADCNPPHNLPYPG